MYLNETDFQKGITGSSFHCKKNGFLFGKYSLYLVAISAEDTEIREEDAEILMLQTFSEKFAKKLIQAEIIPESDADIYVFGCYQFGMMLLNIVTTIGLGILFRLFLLDIFSHIMVGQKYISKTLTKNGMKNEK